MYWYKDTGNDQFKKEYINGQSFVRRFKKALVLYGSLVIIGITAYIIFSGINYIDLSNACYIRIKHNVVSGDKKSIREALRKLREDDYFSYKDVCRYANRIYERDCLIADDDSPTVQKAPTDGCYIEGTKSILIEKSSEYSEELVDKRMQQIQKYGNMAKEYWINQ